MIIWETEGGQITVLGDKMKALRKETGLSQDFIAEKLFTSRSTVQRWEKNQSVPTSNDLTKIAELLNTSVEYLLSDDKEETQPDEKKLDEEAIVKQLVRLNGILADREVRKWKLIKRIMVVAGILLFLYVVLKIIRSIVIC